MSQEEVDLDLRKPSAVEQITRALDLVLRSTYFISSPRLSRFLRFAVEQSINGREDILKEYTIGTEVYGRKPDFDLSHDSIVRTEARRMRRKLQEYYENDGLHDPVIIFFRVGSYVPVFRHRVSVEKDTSINQVIGTVCQTERDLCVIGVAAFQVPPGDPLASAFAFDIADELMQRLITIPGVRVVCLKARANQPAAANISDSSKMPPIIVDGSVRSEADRLSVTVRIVNSEDLLLWSQRFEAWPSSTELRTIQVAVVSAFLGRLDARSFGPPREGVMSRDFHRIVSDVLAAEMMLDEGSTRSIEKALQLLEDAAEKVPGFARVNCVIGQCYKALLLAGAPDTDELRRKGREACLRAIELNGEMAEAHSTLASILAEEWKWEAAEQSFRTSIQLGDSQATHRQYALFLLLFGRWEAASRHLIMAAARDPFSMRLKTATARFFYYSGRELPEADNWNSILLNGQMPLEARLLTSFHQIQQGKVQHAMTLADEIMRQEISTAAAVAACAEIYALLGNAERARFITVQERLFSDDVPLSFFRRAKLSIALGDESRALGMLERSFQMRESELLWLSVDPRFESLRPNQVYKAISQNMYGH